MVEIACVASPHRWERDWGGTTNQTGSKQGHLTDRPKPNLARPPGSRQHHCMASSPSAAFLSLPAFIAERLAWIGFDAVRFAELAGARRLALFHHDPDHDDETLDRLVASASALARTTEVDGAREGTTISIRPRA